MSTENPTPQSRFDATACFLSFLDNTDQKVAHGLIMEALLEGLRAHDVILRSGDPITLMSLGCGDGTVLLSIGKAITAIYNPPVHLYGIDFDERMLNRARSLLRGAKQRDKRIGEITLFKMDILGGEPLPFPPPDNVLAEMSHVMYYAEKENIPTVLHRLLTVIGKDGVAVLSHNGCTCELASLRETVCAEIISKPASSIELAAREQGAELVSFDAGAMLHFPRLTDSEWEATKDRFAYIRGSNVTGTAFAKALDLISFIAQQDLTEISTEGKLNELVDGIRNKVDEKGYIKLVSRYQLLISPKRDQRRRLRMSLQRVADDVKKKLPVIEKCAARKYAVRV